MSPLWMKGWKKKFRPTSCLDKTERYERKFYQVGSYFKCPIKCNVLPFVFEKLFN